MAAVQLIARHTLLLIEQLVPLLAERTIEEYHVSEEVDA